MFGLSEIFIILSNVILQSHFNMCKKSRFQTLGWGGGGGKVNQLGYVAPNLYMDEFQEIVSVFCETYPLIVVKAINSNSESIANHC